MTESPKFGSDGAAKTQLKNELQSKDEISHVDKNEFHTENETIKDSADNLQKDMIRTKHIPPRGILKTTVSEPSIIVTPAPKPPQHSASSDDIITKRKRHKRTGFFNDIQTVQEFVNPAFELDENVPHDFKLVEIVEQALQKEVHKYHHPFGKGNLYSTVFLGEKSNVHAEGGRFILWFIFAFALVGMAGVIIFMSEMYKAESSANGNHTVS